MVAGLNWRWVSSQCTMSASVPCSNANWARGSMYPRGPTLNHATTRLGCPRTTCPKYGKRTPPPCPLKITAVAMRCLRFRVGGLSLEPPSLEPPSLEPSPGLKYALNTSDGPSGMRTCHGGVMVSGGTPSNADAIAGTLPTAAKPGPSNKSMTG